VKLTLLETSPASVTVTKTVPLPGGTRTSISVAVTEVTVAGLLPNVTEAPAVKLFP
jgi:hypothetical protein